MLATTWDVFAWSYETTWALEFPGKTELADLACNWVVFPSLVDAMTESLY